MNVPGYRSSGAALCCARIHQGWWHSRCQLLLRTRRLALNRVQRPVDDEWQGGHSFEIQTVWSVCTAVCTVRRMDARQMHAAVDSGCDENVHQMCELPNYGRVPVATEVMALWRRSGDGRALRTHAPLAMERQTTHFRFVRRSGGISVNCRRQMSQKPTSEELPGLPADKAPTRSRGRLHVHSGRARRDNSSIDTSAHIYHRNLLDNSLGGEVS
jgi:hypothetical protein